MTPRYPGLKRHEKFVFHKGSHTQANVDFVVECHGFKFHLHKSMLRKHFQYFENMFSHPDVFTENSTGILKLDDDEVPPISVHALFTAIYTKQYTFNLSFMPMRTANVPPSRAETRQDFDFHIAVSILADRFLIKEVKVDAIVAKTLFSRMNRLVGDYWGHKWVERELTYAPPSVRSDEGFYNGLTTLWANARRHQDWDAQDQIARFMYDHVHEIRKLDWTNNPFDGMPGLYKALGREMLSGSRIACPACAEVTRVSYESFSGKDLTHVAAKSVAEEYKKSELRECGKCGAVKPIMQWVKRWNGVCPAPQPEDSDKEWGDELDESDGEIA